MIHYDANLMLYVLEYDGEQVGYYRFRSGAEDKLRQLEVTFGAL